MKVITFEKMQEILETLIDKLNTINDKFASKESLKTTDDKLKTLSDSYNAHGPHIELSFDLPKPAENEAQTGASNNAARADHVHPLQTSVLNAEAATKLTESIDITIGSKKESFDGSNNISWTLDEIGAAEKEHTHDFSSSNHNHDDTYEKIGHVHSYNDLTDLPDLSEISGGLNITDTIILKSYESGKTFELNVTPTGNLVTKESSKSEYSEVILRDGDNNKFKLTINDNGVLSIESTTYEKKFKDTYIQAQYPYAEIFRISVFTDNDGSALITSSLNQGLIDNDGVYNNYTWSSIKILEEINKAKESISQPDNNVKQQLNELNETIATLSNTLGNTKLQTEEKTVTAAINELNETAATLSNVLGHTELQTEEKTVTAAINEMQAELDSMLQRFNELFQSASDGKQKIATAITGKGITASSSETFDSLASKINNIKTGLNVISGTYADIITPGHGSGWKEYHYDVVFESELPTTPDRIFVNIATLDSLGDNTTIRNVSVDSKYNYGNINFQNIVSNEDDITLYIHAGISWHYFLCIKNITTKGFRLGIAHIADYTVTLKGINWTAYY